MRNILKADFRRLFKNKGMWIGAAAYAGGGIFIYLLLYWFTRAFDGGGGMDMEMGIPGFGARYIFAILSYVSPLIVVIFGIACTTIVCSDFSQNTIQSYLVSGNPRTKIYISKTLVCVTAAAVISGIMIFSAAALAGILNGWGGTFSAAEFFEFLGRCLLAVLMYCATMCIVVFLSFWLKRSGLVIGISIGVGYIFNAMLSILNMIKGQNLMTGTEDSIGVKMVDVITKIFSISHITSVTAMGGGWKDILFAVICAVLTFVAFGGFGILLFNKKDVK